jgi:hypothetical protein
LQTVQGVEYDRETFCRGTYFGLADRSAGIDGSDSAIRFGTHSGKDGRRAMRSATCAFEAVREIQLKAN